MILPIICILIISSYITNAVHPSENTDHPPDPPPDHPPDHPNPHISSSSAKGKRDRDQASESDGLSSANTIARLDSLEKTQKRRAKALAMKEGGRSLKRTKSSLSDHSDGSSTALDISSVDANQQMSEEKTDCEHIKQLATKQKTMNGKELLVHENVENSLIGRGNSAEIYYGYFPEEQICVAIKHFNGQDASGEFKSELKVFETFKSMQLKHVIRLIAFDANTLEIAMEMGEMNLLKYIKQFYNPKETDKLLHEINQITGKLIDALIELHKVAIHMDLKPGNVVIVGDKVKLIDFALTKLKQSEKEEFFDGIHGTYKYMSWEQAVHKKSSDKSDVWSMGLIVYQMFFGFDQFPYQDYERLIVQASQMAEFDKVQLSKQAEKLEKRYEKVNEPVYKRIKLLMMHCLSKDPMERPSAEGLREMFNGE